MKNKQKEYYDQHTKEQKILHAGEKVRMFRNGKWEPATVLEKLSEPRSYTVKIENERTYRRNRKHLFKTETDDDQTIEISDDDGEPENVNTKTEDVTNEEEERNVEPRR